MTKAAANAPANFKTVTRTIQFLRNQWFLKHDLLKLHYSQLPTTIITITKRNIKRQKTTQTYLTIWIEGVHEMQQGNEHSTTNCMTLLFFSRENFNICIRTRGD